MSEAIVLGVSEGQHAMNARSHSGGGSVAKSAGHDADASVHTEAEEPRVLDTYASVYAFGLLFLLPGVALMSRLPFGDDRSGTYTFSYVSLVTVPYLIGILATFLLDARESARSLAIRSAILTPLSLATGVTIMFGASMVMIPASKFLGIADQGLSVGWWVAYAAVSVPVVISFARRLFSVRGWRDVVTLMAIGLSLLMIVGVTAFSFLYEGSIYDLVRKDVVIYTVGAMSVYLPSFGLAAGLWRRSGLV